MSSVDPTEEREGGENAARAEELTDLLGNAVLANQTTHSGSSDTTQHSNLCPHSCRASWLATLFTYSRFKEYTVSTFEELVGSVLIN